MDDSDRYRPDEGLDEPDARQPASTALHQLDERIVNVWRITTAIGCGVLLFFGLVVWIVASVVLPILLPVGLAAWTALAVLCVWFVCWHPRRDYQSWGYRLDHRVLELRSGIFFQVSRLLPLSRLQHVDLRRGPVERAFGLASLVLYTAGTHAAALHLPGLDAEAAARLRDLLIEIGGDDAV